jgi:polyisoprenoid-binding protein YceI
MSWQIDKAHTNIMFSVRHMMITKVRGSFEKFDGTVELDPEHPENTRVDVSVETASINTRDEQRDAHLRSADFFNAEAFPLMTFQSKRVELTGKENARLIGDLTIRGVTHEVALNVEYNGMLKNPWGKTSAGFAAAAKINRKDWDLTWNVALETGGVLVGDEVEIAIELELVQVPEAETVA